MNLIPERFILKSKRLQLRRFRESDLENVFQGLSHPEVIQYYGIQFSSIEDTQAQMRFFEELEQNDTGQWWAICSADGKEFYGAAGLNDLIHLHKKAEIGFWLLRQHWGNGYISEALPLVCAYGFEQLGLHRIEAIVETENQLSRKLLMKMNFRHEGTLRECEFKNKRFISLDVFSLLANEYH